MKLRSVWTSDAAIEVSWDDGQRSSFHHLWLRDNCACDRCGPHDHGSRLQRLLDIPDDIRAASVQVEAGVLIVTWANDRHRSYFDGGWLRAHSYGPALPHGAGQRPKTLWDASLGAWPAVQWNAVLEDVRERHRLHASVAEVGFVLVRGLGTDRDAIERLAAEVGYVRETHYGRVFDLYTRPDPQILSDLAGPLLPHSDETYRREPTGINIFHCLQPSPDGGGASQLVDAHHLAIRLRETDPDAFDLLTRIPVRHARRIEGQVIVADRPAIVLSYDGEVTEVRLNERTMSALRLPYELMLPAYDALRTCFRLAYDPAYRIEERLESGDALLFDNLRVLHGRTGYGSDRLLRQTQVMRDEFFAKLHWLTEKVEALTVAADGVPA